MPDSTTSTLESVEHLVRLDWPKVSVAIIILLVPL
jgi:hypothetical protein